MIWNPQHQHTSAQSTKEHAQSAAKKFQKAQVWVTHAEFARTATTRFATFALFAAAEEQQQPTIARDVQVQQTSPAQSAAHQSNKLSDLNGLNN